MRPVLTPLRLPLLALLTSFALTSCFGEKKEEPKPRVDWCGTGTTPTTTGGIK